MNKKAFLFNFIFTAFLTSAAAQNEATLVRKGNYFGFQNQQGEWLIEPKYELFDGPFSDFMIAQNDQKLHGAINKLGDTLVPFEFELIKKTKAAGFERDGKRIVFDVFLAQKNLKLGLIDQKGQPIVPIEFQQALWVDDSTVFLSRPGRQIAMNPLRQKTLETDFEQVELLTQDFGKSRVFRVFKNKIGWGAVDFSGKTVLPFEFADIRLGGPSGKTLAVMDEDLHVGVRDLDGRELVRPQFKWIRFLNDSLFVATQAEGPFLGLFDLSGRQRMPFEFVEIEAVGHSGRLKARKKDTKFGLFDSEGRALTFLELADFEAVDDLPALIFAKDQEGKWALLSYEGRHLHYPYFDSFHGAKSLGFVAKMGGLSAIFLADGQRITPFKYGFAQIFHSKNEARKDETAHGLGPETWFVGSIKDGGEWRFIDNFGKEWPLEPVKKSPQKPKPAAEELAFGEVMEVAPEPKIVDFPEKQPEFPGGETAMRAFIAKYLKYPEAARTESVEGTVVVQFVVEKDGSISSPIILKDIGNGCGAAALDAVQAMPKWLPAEQNGQVVRTKFMLPVRFKL